jgi:hypothetical protein
MYGHRWVLRHVQDLTDEEWEAPGVCGVWSVKQIIAHLASYEQVLVEVLSSCLDPKSSTPTLDQFTHQNGDQFNADQVGMRRGRTPGEVLDEYKQIHDQVRPLIPQFTAELLRQPGTIPWYGKEYSLEDFIVYAFYGHKREHCAQIAVYRDKSGK